MKKIITALMAIGFVGHALAADAVNSDIPLVAMPVDKVVAGFLAEEFDLEGTAPEGAEFADLFLDRSPTNSAAAGAG